MAILEWILVIFSWLFFASGIFIIFSCFIGTIRYKDFFIRAHAIKISNIYGVTFMLIALGFYSHDLLVFVQLFLMAVLNVLITITIEHSICRLALSNNITHNGISRRKYNEMISQQEKEEAEKAMKEKIEREKAKLAEMRSGSSKSNNPLSNGSSKK